VGGEEAEEALRRFFIGEEKRRELRCREMAENGGTRLSPTRVVTTVCAAFFEPRGSFSPFLFSPRLFG
jgi:hypothetical protein